MSCLFIVEAFYAWPVKDSVLVFAVSEEGAQQRCYFHQNIFWIKDVGGGPRPVLAVPTLSRWFWVLWESRWGKALESSQWAIFFTISASFPASRLLLWLHLWLPSVMKYHLWTKSTFSFCKLFLVRVVHHSNRRVSRTDSCWVRERVQKWFAQCWDYLLFLCYCLGFRTCVGSHHYGTKVTVTLGNPKLLRIWAWADYVLCASMFLIHRMEFLKGWLYRLSINGS